MEALQWGAGIRSAPRPAGFPLDSNPGLSGQQAGGSKRPSPSDAAKPAPKRKKVRVGFGDSAPESPFSVHSCNFTVCAGLSPKVAPSL